MLRKLYKFSKNDSGFTLVELMLVVIIIGVLSAVLVPNFTETKKSAEVGKIRADIKLLESMAAMYYVDHGKYPEVVDELVDYLRDGEIPKYEKGGDFEIDKDNGKVWYKIGDTEIYADPKNDKPKKN